MMALANLRHIWQMALRLDINRKCGLMCSASSAIVPTSDMGAGLVKSHKHTATTRWAEAVEHCTLLIY